MTETAKLTAAIAAWMKEVIWAAVDVDVIAPEQLIKELTWDYDYDEEPRLPAGGRRRAPGRGAPPPPRPARCGPGAS